MKIVNALNGQRLDEIVYIEYGTLKNMEKVLDMNPHLTSKILLDSSDLVTLPIVEIALDENKEDELW